MITLTPATSTALAVAPAQTAPQLPALAPDKIQKLLADFLAEYAPRTVETYKDALAHFAGHVGHLSVGTAASKLLSLPHGEANWLAAEYKAKMIADGHAPKTINLRLSALRVLTAAARRFGLVPWKLEVKNIGERDEEKRQTMRGPVTADVGKMLDHAGSTPALEARNRALMLLLHDIGLRREEARMLDLADVDFPAGKITSFRKGRRIKIARTITPAIAEALTAWLEFRGPADGPLFTRLDVNRDESRLERISGEAIRRITHTAARRAGVGKCRPHGLRHSGATLAAEVSGGDILAVCAWGGWRNLATAQLYVDGWRDKAGEMARKISAARAATT
jgi:integrase/recombinase XerC